jgi:hypothetical protein
MGRFIPRGGEPNGGRGKAVWPVLLACGLVVATSVGAFAQAADNIRTFHFPARTFYVPFSLKDNDPRITELLLNYSKDGQNYRYYGSARPNERRFYFTAPADGCYYFIVQTRDAGGVVTPENLRSVPPSDIIRVYVDTQNPVVEEFTADASTGNALPTIHWKISEANLKEVLADYRSVNNGQWMPLFLEPPQAQGKHTWKPSWSGELEVRLWAIDQAGHSSEVRTLRLHVANNVARMPPPPESAGGKVMFVKSKTFQLHYTLDEQTIGPSKVASVDIWKLHPGQGGWRKCPEKGQPIGPATVSVETAGRWGFRLIPCSGVGLRERDPLPGDAPDIWVEVDDKPPLVRVTNVTVTQEADGGYLTVYWKADDAFLHAMPITIYLASPQGGNWTPVAQGLPNTGYWRQKTDDLKLGDNYEFALKVSAIDEAGNMGENQWRDTVKVDLMVPRIKHIEVQPGGAAAGRQQTYGASGATSLGGSLLDSPPTSRPTPSPLTGSDKRFDRVK